MWQMGALAGSTSAHQGFPGPDFLLTVDAPIMAIMFVILKSISGSPVVAWNVSLVGGLLVLLWGTISLAHRLSPKSSVLPRVALVIAIMGAPGWVTLVDYLGMSAIPMMVLPLALSTIDKWIQPRAKPLLGLCAGTLGVVAASGHWVTSVLVMAVLIPMVVIQCRNIEGRQVWVRAGWATLPALMMCIVLVGLNAAPHKGLRIPPETLGATWIYQLEGALQLPATAVVALPGLGLLLLVLAGVAARPVRTVGWLLVGAWGILLAAGLGADGYQSLAPAHQLALRIPVLNHLDSWWAIAPLVSIPLGLIAMTGAEALHKVRRERLAAVVLMMALVDQTIPNMRSQPDRAFPAEPPRGVQTALSNMPDGGVLQLPAADHMCTTHQLWQLAHGRPVSTPPRGQADGGMKVSYIARLTARQVAEPGVRASTDSPIDPDTFECAASDIGTLQDLGFIAVVLDRSRGLPPLVDQTLSFVLGEPVFDDDEAAVWSLEKLESKASSRPCPLPKNPHKRPI
jgi:hypothetical protein